MTTKTINERYRDALIRHQIGLMQVSESIKRDLVKLLNETEKEVAAELQRKLARVVRKGGADPKSPLAVRRLKELDDFIKLVRKEAIGKAYKTLKAEMLEMMREEALFLAQAAETVTPVVFNYAIPEFDTLKGLVTTDPMQGATMRQWASQLAVADAARMSQQVRIGIVMGETTQQITRRLFGTQATNGAGSAAQITRRQMHAITRTSVNHFANATKQEFYLANPEVFKKELYVATLDERTTLICASYDGLRYVVGEGPIPPVHWQCRSLRVPVFEAAVLGDRPAKPFTEKQLVREYTKKWKIKYQRRSDLPRGTKAKFDAFKRKRVRELTGRVPGSQNFTEFLNGQSKAFQNDYLGATRAKLFRNGGLELKKFTHFDGRELSLRELVKRERAAFVKAGLNPDNY